MTVVVPHLTHGGGAGWNSSDMTAAPLISGGSTSCLSAIGAWRRAVADDERSLRLILSRVCRKVHQSKLGHSRFRIRTEGSELGHYP
jgi:hypothetical protein